jgi:hypothetical protein
MEQHNNTEHELMLRELAEIKARLDKDWQIIEATHLDMVFRNRIWGIIKWIGFGGSTAIVIRLTEYLFK